MLASNDAELKVEKSNVEKSGEAENIQTTIMQKLHQYAIFFLRRFVYAKGG
jgi:hypothetical protein